MKVKRVLMSSQDFPAFYRFFMKNSRRGRKRIIKKNADILYLQSVIWKTIVEHYLNNIGGVYIDNLGYLCHRIVPRQSFPITRNKRIVAKIETNGYVYRHECLDFLWMKRDKKIYYHLHLSKILKKKSNELMKKGVKYKFLYREVMAKKHIFREQNIPSYTGKEVTNACRGFHK